MKQIRAIMRKELDSYFGSPLALIFIGVFLAVTLFVFFWVDAFFSRGIADVRPLFQWMPLLLIFLVAALTMRQWSEEQRSGTLEMLLTLPVRPVQLVLGKFFSVLILVAITLSLTISLPITVELLGNLDWGPVIGGYLAAILLAAAYTAIGLFVSSRTDNQIVALISTAVVGGLFYFVGSGGILEFVSGDLESVLRALGTGSRFESIERGVIDLRDLVYYLSLTGVFLTLNVVSLDAKRWSSGQRTLGYRRSLAYTAVLIGLNLALLNVWLYPLHALRLDITESRRYTLSQTTKDLLGNLQEPLLIRAYVSERTHPLLEPLVPQIRDTLREYEIVSDGTVTAEVVDPTTDPELEAEANQTYGIRPQPFQVSGRYESSVINSYFDILIRYGDQNVVLNFQDLIEVVPDRATGTADVRLRNLEYDLTRSIKRVVYGFQSVDAVLASVEEPVTLTAVVTPDTLPQELQGAPETIRTVAEQIQQEAGADNFTFEVVNPNAPGSSLTPQTLQEQYNVQPIPISLFSNQGYYLHMLLTIGDETQVVYPQGDFSEASVRTAIESALKRASPGFLKVVGIWTPPTQQQNMMGQQQPPLATYQLVTEQLRREYEVRSVDLSSGQVPAEVDVLLVIAPQQMDDVQRYAIDQYLMRGGSVIVAAGNYTIAPGPGGLALQPVEESLREMLQHYGVTVEESLVMDPQNQPFPVQVPRDVGGMQVQEIQAIDYPFFVDVRPDGMNTDSPIASNLPAVTMNWVSPVAVDEQANADRTVTTLLESSPQSWLRTDTTVQPNFQQYPEHGFAVEGEQRSHPLAAAIQGSFQSYFEDKESPLEAAQETEEGAEQPAAQPTPETSAVGTIASSPDSARLVVVGSAEFVNDTVLQLSSQLSQDRYLHNLQFVQNSVDWSVEDLDLLGIRSGGSYAHVLAPMTEQDQQFWELVNYAFALVALLGIGAVWYLRRRSEQPMELEAAPATVSSTRAPSKA